MKHPSSRGTASTNWLDPDRPPSWRAAATLPAQAASGGPLALHPASWPLRAASRLATSLSLGIMVFTSLVEAASVELASPNGAVLFHLSTDAAGHLVYAIEADGSNRLEPARAFQVRR